jgi:hypothetical protein
MLSWDGGSVSAKSDVSSRKEHVSVTLEIVYEDSKKREWLPLKLVTVVTNIAQICKKRFLSGSHFLSTNPYFPRQKELQQCSRGGHEHGLAGTCSLTRLLFLFRNVFFILFVQQTVQLSDFYCVYLFC